MVSLAELQQALETGGDWVALDAEGELVDLAVPRDVGPVALVVSRVTDALKVVSADGLVVDAPRRDQVWQLKAFVLNRVVVEALASRYDSLETPAGLMTAIEELGFGWQVKPVDDA